MDSNACLNPNSTYWKKAALDDLGNHSLRKASLINLQQRIAALEEKFKSDGMLMRNSNSDKLEILDEGNVLLEYLAQRDRLKLAYSSTKRLVDIVERGLGCLAEQERTALMEAAVLNKSNVSNQVLIKNCYLPVWGNEVFDNALAQFTLTVYGITEL